MTSSPEITKHYTAFIRIDGVVFTCAQALALQKLLSAIVRSSSDFELCTASSMVLVALAQKGLRSD